MIRTFRITLIMILLSTPALAAKELQYRVWQLQDYNMPHMRQMVKLAAQQKINRIQLSHKIIMDAEDIVLARKPNLARDVNEICELAHSRGIKVDLWTHELQAVPEELLVDGKANLDDPRLWQWMKEKYARLFELCPEVDGVVLTMQETAMSIYHEKSVASSIPPEMRVARLIDNIAGVCKSLGKKMFVRTFSYKPDELEYICKGLRESKSDIIVMSKCQPHDWQPFYPHNPAIGNVGEHPQIMEFDLGYEFLGLSTVPYIDLDYLKYRLDYGLSKGIVGGVLRIERYKWWAYGTLNWSNVEVFSKMLLDPSLDQKALFHEWVARRYGKEAAPYVASALNRTFDIVNKSYFALGFWYTNHSLLPGYNGARNSIWEWSSAKWDKRKKLLEISLLNPTQAIVKRVDAEKDEAVRLAELSAADIEKAKPFLAPEDYLYLKGMMEREKATAQVWKEHMHTFFAIKIAQKSGSPEDKAKVAESAARLEAVAAKYHRELVDMASDYARPDNDANVKGVREMLGKAREVVK